MPTTFSDKWEQVADCTYRLKVPGGWLYLYREFGNSGMAFVPEPEPRHLR